MKTDQPTRASAAALLLQRALNHNLMDGETPATVEAAQAIVEAIVEAAREPHPTEHERAVQKIRQQDPVIPGE